MPEQVVVAGENPEAAVTAATTGQELVDVPGTEVGEGEPFDKDRAMATIRALRQYEKRAKALEAELTPLKKKAAEMDAQAEKQRLASMTEAEQLKANLAKLQAEKEQLAEQVLTMQVRGSFVAQAVKLGFHNPEDAYLLADLSEVEVGENGEVSGVEAALKALVKARPYLAKGAEAAPDIDAAKAGKSTGKGGVNVEELKRRWGIGG